MVKYSIRGFDSRPRLFSYVKTPKARRKNRRFRTKVRINPTKSANVLRRVRLGENRLAEAVAEITERQKRERMAVQEIYQKLGDLVADGSLSATVEQVYPLEQFKGAFEQSLKSNRSGKILFKFRA
jgi:NADPH:quinone reductase-like Zn-dependent oxidoreductase